MGVFVVFLCDVVDSHFPKPKPSFTVPREMGNFCFLKPIRWSSSAEPSDSLGALKTKLLLLLLHTTILLYPHSPWEHKEAMCTSLSSPHGISLPIFYANKLLDGCPLAYMDGQLKMDGTLF